MRDDVLKAKRLVVKVGSTLVTDHLNTGLSDHFINECARQIGLLQKEGKDVILVSSGAISVGMNVLGWHSRPKDVADLRAAAAIGQISLAKSYDVCFRRYHSKTAQVLLTHEDLSHRLRYLNARSTLVRLLQLGVVPVINENDTVITDEIKFGDNDTLGALVANLIGADLLLIMTDCEGLFNKDPAHYKDVNLISQAQADDKSLLALAGSSSTQIGTGGMRTKIKAARRAAKSGADTIIFSGKNTDSLLKVAAGEEIGTYLVSSMSPIVARKRWLADQLQVGGQFFLDAGACQALMIGKSLLPIGVKKMSGKFERGAMVSCLSLEGKEVARGLSNYSSSESCQILGKTSQDIQSLLGYTEGDEIIHRDNLILV